MPPTLPPPEAAPSALLSTYETGRLETGGIYAHFGVVAPADAVYTVLADDAAMSTWIPHLSRSEVLSTGQPCNRVAFDVPSPIGLVSYQLSRCRDGHSLWWTLAEGERFEKIEGGYLLETISGGTLVHYWSAVVARIPVPVSAQEQIARIGIGDLVNGLRAEVARRSAR